MILNQVRLTRKISQGSLIEQAQNHSLNIMITILSSLLTEGENLVRIRDCAIDTFRISLQLHNEERERTDTVS